MVGNYKVALRAVDAPADAKPDRVLDISTVIVATGMLLLVRAAHCDLVTELGRGALFVE